MGRQLSKILRSFSILSQAKEDLGARAYLVEEQISPHLTAAQLTPDAMARINRICLRSGMRSGTRITVIIPSGDVIGSCQRERS